MPLEEGYTTPTTFTPPKKKPYTPPKTFKVPLLEQEKKYGAEPVVEPPKVIIPEIGDDFESLGDKYGVDPLALQQANTDVGGVQAGAALSLPRLGGEKEEAYIGDDTRTDKDKWRDMFSDEEWFYFQNLGYDAQVFDEQYYGGAGMGMDRAWGFDIETGEEITFQDTIDQGFRGETRAEGEAAVGAGYNETLDFSKIIRYPTGWNPELFREFIEGYYNIDEEAFMENYQNLDFSEYSPDSLKDIEGMTDDAFYYYENEWIRKGEEEVFDELYLINGIDPENDAQVEAFWSYATDDLLFMGDYFDAIKWPDDGGGYGGYSSPSYGGSRRPQQSRDYRSYLQLTSWSI